MLEMHALFHEAMKQKLWQLDEAESKNPWVGIIKTLIAESVKDFTIMINVQVTKGSILRLSGIPQDEL